MPAKTCWPDSFEFFMKKIKRSFYNRDTSIVAEELLGKYLVHHIDDKKYIGKIVEVEAYLGSHDLACHTSKGLTKRTEIMFGPPGHAYVYLIYGMHHCMNVVTEKAGNGAAVLIRALEPIQDIIDGTNGPGRLCRAMQINKQLNGQDLLSKNFYIADSQVKNNFTITKRPRIGVDYAGSWAKKLLRFYIKDNAHISKK
jgi:DNA-3-methyladenine glycosylase